MGDSDDEYNQVNNSSSGINLNSSNTNNNNQPGLNNSYNNNNNKKNRDKFYRERDDNSINNNNNNNNNYQNNPRRDWSGGDRGGRSSSNNDVWKNRNMNNSMPAQSGYGSYQQQQQQQQQRMNTSNNNNDYPRKYTATTTTTSPANFDSNSPPYKRNKKEWDSNDSNRHSTGGGGGDSYSSNNYHHSGNNNNNNKGNSHNHHHHHHHHNHSDYKSQTTTNASTDMPDYPTQPPFLSFKLFLQQQDDNISDEEAIRKYNDYKTDFKKTQINNFFLEHKEEDWFKQRYHPDENYKRRNEQNQFILNRLDVFMDLMQNQTSWFDAANCEMDHSKDLIKFLDAVVIKLEGGSDQDLKKCLESNSNGENNNVSIIKEIKKDDEKPKSEEGGDEGEVTTTTNGNGKKEHNNDEENNNNNDEAGLVNKKRKSEDSGSESGAYTDSDDDQNNDNHHHKKKKNKRTNNNSNSVVAVKHDLHKTSSIFMRNLAPSVTKQDLELLCKSYDGFKRVALSDPGPERGFFRRGWITFESNVDVKKICWSLQNTKIKDFNPGAIVNRELTNRIRSIPNLVSHHKSVIKNDIKLAMKIVQSMDKRWNLWQDNDNDLDESLEKQQNTATDQQHQQTTTGTESTGTDSTTPATNTTEGGQTVDNESKETANLEKEASSKLKPMGVKYLANKFKGTNPLLNNITDYLVDEANAEEEELLSSGLQTNSTKSDTTISNTTSSSSSSSFDIEIDHNYSRVLDRLVLYLRIVHSIDFYNSTEYQQEDSMPNRCGIMFVRPALPLNAAAASLKITQDEINQYTQQFELKMKPFIEYKDKLDLEQARKLGIKEREEEVQKFIKTNTQELAADRWLCPLSGKKFKGPEFIRKHLFYKHMDKIVEVKKEVEYFNNYVFDLKRPQLPEHPSNNKSASSVGTNQSNSNSHSSSYQSHSQSNYSNSNQQQQQQQHQSNYSTANIQPGLLASPNMMSSGYSMQNNRQMSGGWQGSYNMPNNNMMSGYGGSNFGGGGYSNMMGGGGGGGQYAGFKKPGFDNRRGIGSNNSREMIQYKDLDAPEDN